MNKSIYLALDFPTWTDAKQFLDLYQLEGVPVKIGMELFYKEGPKVIEELKKNNHPIFLDLKLHDIPTTVMRAMHNIASLGVDIVNVHAIGGTEMIKRAKEGLTSVSDDTKLIAVTVLTSMDNETMNKEMLIDGKIKDIAVHFSKLSKQSGADGVVCSVHEAEQIKETCGMDFLTVTPGIRLEDSAKDDQKRIATPKYAVENRADILVIGRSITKATNPKAAYERAIKECGLN